MGKGRRLSSVLATLPACCWVPGQLGALSTFLSVWMLVPEAALAKSLEERFQHLQPADTGPRFLSIWLQGGHRRAVHPTWPREGTEAPLPPSDAVREVFLTFSGAPKPTAKEEEVRPVGSEYSNSTTRSLNRCLMNTLLCSTRYARCLAYSREQTRSLLKWR